MDQSIDFEWRCQQIQLTHDPTDLDPIQIILKDGIRLDSKNWIHSMFQISPRLLNFDLIEPFDVWFDLDLLLNDLT